MPPVWITSLASAVGILVGFGTGWGIVKAKIEHLNIELTGVKNELSGVKAELGRILVEMAREDGRREASQPFRLPPGR